MGLDVGTVQIDYPGRPVEATYDFLRYLNINAEEADWNVAAPGNTFVEYLRENMLAQLDAYVAMKSLSQDNVDIIRGWMDDLPWRGDVIMLHLSW